MIIAKKNQNYHGTLLNTIINSNFNDYTHLTDEEMRNAVRTTWINE